MRTRRSPRTALLLALVAAATLCAAPKWTPVQAEAVWSGSPKEKGAVVVRLDIAPGWQVVSNAPEDPDAYPCSLELKSTGIRFAAPKWPEPNRTPVPELGLDKLWFGGKVEIVVPAKAVGPYDTTATAGAFGYQACQGKMCLAPEKVEILFK